MGSTLQPTRLLLQTESPTVAVLGHGLKTIYPSIHSGVARSMLANGGHLTDFASDTLPERNNFIRRNRIIAGISDATLIVESGIKGGRADHSRHCSLI